MASLEKRCPLETVSSTRFERARLPAAPLALRNPSALASEGIFDPQIEVFRNRY